MMNVLCRGLNRECVVKGKYNFGGNNKRLARVRSLFGGLWEFWGVCGSFGGFVGVLGSLWGFWGVCGGFGGFVGVLGGLWEFWGVCGSFGGFVGVLGKLLKVLVVVRGVLRFFVSFKGFFGF